MGMERSGKKPADPDGGGERSSTKYHNKERNTNTTIGSEAENEHVLGGSTDGEPR